LFALIDGVGQGAAWPTLASAHAITADAALAASAGGDALEMERDPDIALVRAQPVCIASSTWSFGKLGDTLLFVYRRHQNQLRVGYFAYFDVERPWGQNLLTYSVLPATLIDATYSHFAFVFPGVQRLLYGPGDVEGASVLYDVSSSGALSVRGGLADDDHHQSVELSRADLSDSAGRVVLMTSVWSHQLGTPGAARYSEQPGAQVRCFEGRELQPLTRSVAERFRIGSFAHPLRARPAFYGTGSP
jgi:hypothetical protein